MTDTTPGEAPLIRRRSRLRRWLKWLVIALIVLLVSGELVARYVIGLGDPPLTMVDPQTEYRFKPSMTYHRFGHLVHYNAYSMRSDDFPAHKTDPRELRVMVVGDSVVNGGVKIDQSQVCTTVLQSRLRSDLGRPVIVGNCSDGGWGPPNELGYLKEFGTFDADFVIIVFNSEDSVGVIDGTPKVGVHPEFPDHKPISALWEAFDRYGPGAWWLLTHPHPPPEPVVVPPPDVLAKDEAICSDAVKQMIELVRANKVPHLIVAQYLFPGEISGTILPGHQVLLDAIRSEGIEPLQLGDAFKRAVANGEHPFMDIRHPDATGHKIIADELARVIESDLARSSTQPSISP